eukprot:scaffold121877_cov34-Tisochrysis_lutea.AAC.2
MKRRVCRGWRRFLPRDDGVSCSRGALFVGDGDGFCRDKALRAWLRLSSTIVEVSASVELQAYVLSFASTT